MSDKRIKSTERVPLEELRNLEEYHRLTEKQKLFVQTYIQSGVDTGVYDSVTATMTAYNCATPEIARIFSYAIMKNIRMVAILNLHFARAPLSSFLEMLDRAIKNKKLSIAQFKALQLKARVMGFDSRLPGADEQAADVVPPDVIAREKTEKRIRTKDKRRNRIRTKPVIVPPSEFDQMSKF